MVGITFMVDFYYIYGEYYNFMVVITFLGDTGHVLRAVTFPLLISWVSVGCELAYSSLMAKLWKAAFFCTVWYVSSEAAGEIWNWSLLGVKGLNLIMNRIDVLLNSTDEFKKLGQLGDNLIRYPVLSAKHLVPLVAVKMDILKKWVMFQWVVTKF